MENKKTFKQEMINLCVVLCAITAITALVLGTVNGITAPKIEQLAIEATNEALSALTPDAETFEPVELSADADEIVLEYYKALKGTEVCGYSVKVAPVGFGGPIEMMVALDASGAVIGTEIISLSETPGLGTKLQTEPTFAPQFIGKSGTLNIVKGSAGSDSDIVAITGATISSTAMTTGVNAAINYVAANK